MIPCVPVIPHFLILHPITLSSNILNSKTTFASGQVIQSFWLWVSSPSWLHSSFLWGTTLLEISWSNPTGDLIRKAHMWTDWQRSGNFSLGDTERPSLLPHIIPSKKNTFPDCLGHWALNWNTKDCSDLVLKQCTEAQPEPCFPPSYWKWL